MPRCLCHHPSTLYARTDKGACHYEALRTHRVSRDVGWLQAIVHYGQACMCPLSRLPTRYVFGHKPLCVQDAAQALAEAITPYLSLPDTPVVIFLEHGLAHHEGHLHLALGARAKKTTAEVCPVLLQLVDAV